MYRNHETRTIAALFCFGFTALGLVILISEESLLSGLPACLFFVVTGATVLWRWGRQGIYTSDIGIEIRGAFTTRRLEWSEISTFDLRTEARDMVTWVDLMDGTSIAARALNAGRGSSNAMIRRAQEQVDKLNALLRQQKGQSSYESRDRPTPIERHDAR